jgi:3-hydroxyisobutyrate dehydrogenase-like beta-hydroxyacid dehydrogenase
MGGAFAGHLAAAGLRTLGYDLIPAKMHALNAQGGESRPSARAVAAEAGVIVTSLPHSEALEDALFGTEGVVAAGRPGILVIETSTLPLEARESARARLAAAGIGMLDAPVSGTGGQAKTKDITVFASGEARRLRTGPRRSFAFRAIGPLRGQFRHRVEDQVHRQSSRRGTYSGRG